MKAINAVRDIMTRNSISIKQLSESLDITPHTLQARIDLKRASSLSIDRLNAICRQLGYKVVIAPAAVRTPGYELDDGLEDPL